MPGTRQRHQTGVFRFAVADGDVHRLAEQVGDAVAEVQTNAQARMLALEIVEPGQQHIAAEIRRGGKLQHAGDVLAATGQLPLPLGEALQGASRMGQELLAFRGQAQAAGGAHEQAGVELLLQALERGAGHGGRDVALAGSGREAAVVGGADKQGEIVEAQHFQISIERPSLSSRFFLSAK